MARYLFGVDGGSNVTDTFGNKLNRACTIWSARTGGTQVTDLQMPDGTAISGGVVSPMTNGSIGFLGPNDDRSPKWADFGDTAGRWHIPPVQVSDIAIAEVSRLALLATAKGVPSGVASLGTDGILAVGQRPPTPTVITDHGALAGLGDDDHPQYMLQSEADARYILTSTGLLPAVILTQAAYDALPVQDPNTLYVIVA